MNVRELSQLFMSTDPKQKCVVQTKSYDTVYQGRIEFLNYCNNPIEEYEIVELQIGELDDAGEWDSDLLVITINK